MGHSQGLIHKPPSDFMDEGRVGVGKSAIAQTCVERLKHTSIPCASFFFFVNGRKDPECLFSTIAYKLSLAMPDYHDVPKKRISIDEIVLSKPLRTQFQGLITKPLQELIVKKRIGSVKRIVITTDGLDECR
ncbi:hypothetical protein D9756_007782 [Leucocoprinus leucothites]|uniref:Nephrocystin 3-like N-terminal domain-containing protein n=1 Tax=Leucocoprinus leucothites TaxID=201217 RepID=A0A8H5FXU9_9AGAR|nr:hypothetical protein D9756_007782 [Leucoagaricus leucothites]